VKLSNDISAIVTGGASGLGNAVAMSLSSQDVKVTVIDRDVDKGAKAAADIGAFFAEADVTDAASVTAALEAARAKNGQERICVNCAGIAPAAKTVGRDGAHDLGLFQTVININLVGSFNVASQSAAGMVAAGFEADCAGVIINTASIAAFEGQIGQVAYAASKGGIAGLTLPMALAAKIPNPARLGQPNEFAALAMHIIENDFLNGNVIRLDGAARLTPR